MNLHPTITELSGIISVQVTAQFTGASTDANDRQRILAYGDPKINVAGLFTDPNNTAFSFSFPVSELYAGITTALPGYIARFMIAEPITVTFGQPAPSLGPLDCVTPNPQEAATVWAAAIQARALAAMTTLRAQTAVLTSLPDVTI